MNPNRIIKLCSVFTPTGKKRKIYANKKWIKGFNKILTNSKVNKSTVSSG